jgi:hypothetical protein
MGSDAKRGHRFLNCSRNVFNLYSRRRAGKVLLDESESGCAAIALQLVARYFTRG